MVGLMLGCARGRARLSFVLDIVSQRVAPTSGASIRRIQYLHSSTTRQSAPPDLPPNLRTRKPSSAPGAPAAPSTSPPSSGQGAATSVPPPSAGLTSRRAVRSILFGGPQDRGWPWRSIPSSNPAFEEEERLIYARPYEGPLGKNVRLLFILVPLYGIMVGFYLTTPKLQPRSPSSIKNAEDGSREVVIPWQQDPTKDNPTIGSELWRYTTPVAMFGITLMGAITLISPSRFVTRLSVIRQRAAGTPPSSSDRVFLRMSHGGHLMMTGSLALPRDLPLSRVSVHKMNGRSPYLSLNVSPPEQANQAKKRFRDRFSLDALSYRLDFRESQAIKNTDEEVVLSLERIEKAFGRL